jgi:gliding motility-associated-like protein
MQKHNFNPSLFRVLSGILFFLLIQNFLSAQATLCGGTLGSNIFSGGNFGSGFATIYPIDPKLAPGFLYTTQMPPGDGKYTLTNDMSRWSSIWPTWLQIGDNSEDPGGYMMVVNASDLPGIFYEQLIDNVCENTLYEFSADAINLIRNGIGGHILPDVSFYINDVLQYTTGPIQQDEMWHTYGFTFTSDFGQSTLKLTLRNNAPGGGGNDLALDNISFRACGPNAIIDLQPGGKFCESEQPLLTAQIDADNGFIQWQMSDDSLNWNDLANANARTYKVQELLPGKYYFRFMYAATLSTLVNSQCRIISGPVSFEILPSSYYTETAIVCEGLSYAFGDSIYHEAGFYQHAFKRHNQCDSIVTLELILFPDPLIITDYEIIPPSCEGATDGSIRILSVTGIESPYKLTLNNGLVLPPQSTLTVSAGIYTAIVSNEYGCFDRQELNVPDGPPLQIQTIEDTSLLYGQHLLLNTSSNLPVLSARWTPGVHMNCSSCLSTEVIVKGNITYIVEAKTVGGCMAKDSINIAVSHLPVRYIPNVFTPNNDQVNDVFEILIEPISFKSIDNIVVFDRWGELVHQQSNLIPEDFIEVWDGKTTRGPASSGVYFFNINYTLSDGTQENIKGDVTVIK